jgi:hypothetical protein
MRHAPTPGSRTFFSSPICPLYLTMPMLASGMGGSVGAAACSARATQCRSTQVRGHATRGSLQQLKCCGEGWAAVAMWRRLQLSSFRGADLHVRRALALTCCASMLSSATQPLLRSQSSASLMQGGSAASSFALMRSNRGWCRRCLHAAQQRGRHGASWGRSRGRASWVQVRQQARAKATPASSLPPPPSLPKQARHLTWPPLCGWRAQRW